jgi:hypothetical protein
VIRAGANSLPTYERTRRFDRDYERLSKLERAEFRVALLKFLEDLPGRRFRAGLRVKGIQAAEGVFEMSWSGDGRATFQYGDQVEVGQPHVIWRRIGSHTVLGDP